MYSSVIENASAPTNGRISILSHQHLQHPSSSFAAESLLRGISTPCLRVVQQLPKSVKQHRQNQSRSPQQRPLSRDLQDLSRQLCHQRVFTRQYTIVLFSLTTRASMAHFWIGSRAWKIQELCHGEKHGLIHRSTLNHQTKQNNP